MVGGGISSSHGIGSRALDGYLTLNSGPSAGIWSIYFEHWVIYCLIGRYAKRVSSDSTVNDLPFQICGDHKLKHEEDLDYCT